MGSRGGVTPAIAVITHNSAADLARFLAGQLATVHALGTTAVVVDNDSRDATPALLASAAAADPSLKLVRMRRNAGYAAAVNAAFAALPGRDFLLINPDIELPGPEPVRVLAELLEREPRLAVVAPRLIGDDGEVQPSARRFPSLLALLGSLPSAHRLPPARRAYQRYLAPSAANTRVTVDWVLGAAMLIRRAAYEQVGGWDEHFFLYVEDVDFCRRCIQAGWEVAYIPDVQLRHAYAKASDAASASVLSSSSRRHHYKGHARLFLREPRLLLRRGRTRTRQLAGPSRP